MATFPTVETVKESLKRIRATSSVTLPSPPPPEVANKVIDLDCKIRLSPGWEQRLDIKTGDIYFINHKTGIRIDHHQHHDSPGRSYKSSDDYSDDSSDETETDDDDDVVDIANNGKSSASAASPPRPGGGAASAANPLVVVACRRCCKYMMVAREMKGCPHCGQTLVRFTQERCF